MFSLDSTRAEPEDRRLEDAKNLLLTLLKQWGHCDVLLDRELSDPFTDELATLQDGGRVGLVNPKRASMSTGDCPAILRLSSAESSLLDASVDISARQNTDPRRPVRAVGGWLFGKTTNVGKVATHLASAVVVRIAGAADAMLRPWDPRTIAALQRILTPEQFSALMGPIEVWAWMDRAGKIQTIERDASAPATLPFKLSIEQDEAIDRIELFNTLLKTFAHMDRFVSPESDEALDSLLKVAHDKGHRNEFDALAYAVHAWIVGRDFDGVPEVKDAIIEMKTRGFGLARALEKFDDDYWAAYQARVAAGNEKNTMNTRGVLHGK